jgi:hypothetical protein
MCSWRRSKVFTQKARNGHFIQVIFVSLFNFNSIVLYMFFTNENNFFDFLLLLFRFVPNAARDLKIVPRGKTCSLTC